MKNNRQYLLVTRIKNAEYHNTSEIQDVKWDYWIHKTRKYVWYYTFTSNVTMTAAYFLNKRNRDSGYFEVLGRYHRGIGRTLSNTFFRVLYIILCNYDKFFEYGYFYLITQSFMKKIGNISLLYIETGWVTTENSNQLSPH